MKSRFSFVVAGMLLSLPAFAHHSFSAEFDEKQTVTLKGTVTKVEWQNPHVWFYIDVKGEDGAIQHWQCENGPPNILTRNGWRRDSIKPGDEITVNAVRAKDGTNTANARDVILPSGKKVFAGSNSDSER